MISPTWGFPPRRRSDGARAGCSRASPGAPACGKHGCHDRPEAEPRPCRVPRPPRGMPPGRPRWPPAEPRPRSRASVPGALLVGAQRWPAAGISWRRTRNGQNPRPHRPAGGRRQTRARGGGTHRRDLRRPKGPDVSVLASSSSTCMINSPIRFMAMSSSAFTGSPLRSSEASIPAIAPRHCSPENLHGQLPRPVPPARHAKAAQPHACASPSTAGQVPAGLPAKPGPKTWEPSSPSFTTGPSTATLKIVGHVPVLLGHFD